MGMVTMVYECLWNWAVGITQKLMCSCLGRLIFSILYICVCIIVDKLCDTKSISPLQSWTMIVWSYSQGWKDISKLCWYFLIRSGGWILLIVIIGDISLLLVPGWVDFLQATLVWLKLRQWCFHPTHNGVPILGGFFTKRNLATNG